MHSGRAAGVAKVDDHRVAAACLVAFGVFALYFSTLLPGFDFGDTGSFQATVGSSVIDARKAYPAYFAFLLVAGPNGWRSVFQPRVVVIALACAAAGALQYTNTLRAEWLVPDPPKSIGAGLQMFWFDVTKADWRDTTVLTVPRSMLADRRAMYWFDLTQQFGVIGPILAALGAVELLSRDWKRALLIILMYASNIAFAFSYNVGDSHVFYLPSHLAIALLAASGMTALGRVAPLEQPVLGALLVAYAGYRAFSDKPALARSRDVRPPQFMKSLTAGADDQDAILVTQLNWQLQNGLSYFAKEIRPEV